MNDDTEHCSEHRKPTRHLATQAGCGHWAPIVPADQAGERAVAPSQAESTVSPVGKNPGLRETTEVARHHRAVIRDSD